MTALELIAAVMASNLKDTAKLEAVRRIAASEPQHYPVYVPYPTTWPEQTTPTITWDLDRPVIGPNTAFVAYGTGFQIPQHNSNEPLAITASRLQ